MSPNTSPLPANGIGTARLRQRSISGFRFHHMLRRFSRDLDLLDGLTDVEIDRAATRDAMSYMVDRLDIATPVLTFSRRRVHADGTPTGTGATLWSIHDLVEMYGLEQVGQWSDAGLLGAHRQDERIIRLGDPTLLASAAHEAAHLLVAGRTPRAPSHGKRFVAALDDTAEAAARWLAIRHPRLVAGNDRGGESDWK